MRRLLVALASLVALMIVGACGAGDSEGPSASPGDESGVGLLAFDAPLVGGGTFEGASVGGDLVVWFWSPW